MHNAKENIKKLQGEFQEFPWWDPKEEIKGKIKLHISIPAYNNTLNILLDNNIKAAITNSAFGNKLEVNFNFCGGDSLIPRVRDKMAATFLNSKDEWQLQIDDDIVFPYGLGPELAKFYANWMHPDTFRAFFNEGVFRLALSMNAIDEILRSGIKDNKRIVGGLYFWRGGSRNINEAGSVIPAQEDGSFGVEFKLRPDNYIVTDKLSTGFILIHRSVYEDIQDKFPDLEYHIPINITGKSTFAFYNPMVTQEKIKILDPDDPNKLISEIKGFYRSEDYAFTWRAKQCGYDPCLNMNILLGHEGSSIYSWFDRPALQQLLLRSLDNPAHFMERISQK